MRAEALGLIEELNHLGPDTYVAPQCYVYIYAGLGEKEHAMEYQEKAYEDGASPFNYLTPFIRRLCRCRPSTRSDWIRCGSCCDATLQVSPPPFVGAR